MGQLAESIMRATLAAIAVLRIHAAALLVLALGLASAQAGAQRFEQGLLWRVEGGGAAASHVFGTIHVDDPRVTELPPDAARALDGSRSLTVELSLDPANVLALANRMVLQDGRDLAGIVGPELFGKTAVITARLGLPEQVLRLFKPWAAALMLMMPQQNPENVLDFALVRAATERGKPMYELESVSEQVDVFEGMSEPDQVALLKHAVADFERMPRTIDRLVKAYLARDLAAMSSISQEGSNDSAEMRRLNDLFVQRVLDARNVRMADRMQARLKEGGAFVAVGALHLYGSRGVLALLVQRGWRLTRVY